MIHPRKCEDDVIESIQICYLYHRHHLQRACDKLEVNSRWLLQTNVKMILQNLLRGNIYIYQRHKMIRTFCHYLICIWTEFRTKTIVPWQLHIVDEYVVDTEEQFCRKMMWTCSVCGKFSFWKPIQEWLFTMKISCLYKWNICDVCQKVEPESGQERWTQSEWWKVDFVKPYYWYELLLPWNTTSMQ